MHEPVLLHETIKLLDLKPGMRVIDGTVGSGGHAERILDAIGGSGYLLGIDWNLGSIRRAQEYIGEKENVKIVPGNYADAPEILQSEGMDRADAFLLDLGFSSDELGSGRGFSFREPDDPLLMTYSDGTTPLFQALKQMSVTEIEEVIRNYGEERYAGRVARAIREQERKKAIETSGELAEVVKRAVPKGYERGRIHPATRTFQAFRIFINDELGNLKRILDRMTDVLVPGGRMAVISFHSLEDRIVKQAFRRLADEGVVEILTKKPICSSDEEITTNPRSRSAKLRGVMVL